MGSASHLFVTILSIRSESESFDLFLPSYHAPVPRNILRTTGERGWSFVKRAGTVIFAASVVIWTLNNLSFTGGLHYITDVRGGASILEGIGSLMAWLFIPLGFGNWQAAVATILGLMAKEEIVGFFGTLAEQIANNGSGLIIDMESGVPENLAIIGAEFFGGSRLAAFSFLVFNLLCAPCFAAMGAIKREMNNGKWCAFAIGYMCVFAYLSSFCIYQIGSFLTGAFYWWEAITFIISLAIIATVIYLLVRPNPYTEKKLTIK